MTPHHVMDLRPGLCLCLVAFAIGCGGQAVPPPPAAPPPPEAPAPVAVKVAAPPAPPPEAAPETEAAPAARWQAPAGTPQRDIFEFSGPSTVLVEDTSSNARNTFSLATAPKGVDSNHFTVLAPEGTPAEAPPTDAAAPAPTTPPVTLPPGFVAATAELSVEGLPMQILDQRTNCPMRLVEAGTATMGSNSGPSVVQPEVAVFVEAFYMDQCEVTLAHFQAFRTEMLNRKKTRLPAPTNETDPLDYPALGIPWAVAQSFLKALGKEFPTEAEWEHAARGPGNYRYVWGNSRPIWPDRRRPGQISAVFQYPTDRSAYGIYDLAGNAREWCSDWYSDAGHLDATSQASSGPLRNWQGARKANPASTRVVKGGLTGWEAWHRAGINMSDRPTDVGFRGVLRVRGVANAAAVAARNASKPAKKRADEKSAKAGGTLGGGGMSIYYSKSGNGGF